MALTLQCPHYATDGLCRWCMNGKFPCDCEDCDCSDKKYVEIITINKTFTDDTRTICDVQNRPVVERKGIQYPNYVCVVGYIPKDTIYYISAIDDTIVSENIVLTEVFEDPNTFKSYLTLNNYL